LAEIRSDYRGARAYLEESIGIWRELKDDRGLALALGWLTWVDMHDGDAAGARKHLAESLAAARELGDPWIRAYCLTKAANLDSPADSEEQGSLLEDALILSRRLGYRQGIAGSLTRLGIVAFNQGDWDATRTRFEEALALAREMGDYQGISLALLTLIRVAVRQGDGRQAAALWEEKQELIRQFGAQTPHDASLGLLGEIAQEQEEYARAASLFCQELEFYLASGSKHGIAGCLAHLGTLAGRQIQGKRSPEGAATEHTPAEKHLAERAARLLGAWEALREALGVPRVARECAEIERPVAAARGVLGEGAFAAAWAAGRELTIEQAVAEALNQEATDSR
jgi:tetratricopeptide (TPR) repeat protein